MKLGDNGRIAKNGANRESCLPRRCPWNPSEETNLRPKPTIEIGGEPNSVAHPQVQLALLV